MTHLRSKVTGVSLYGTSGHLVVHGKFFPTRSNEGCTFLATTLYTLHWYAVNIVINTWLATAQQDRAAISQRNIHRLLQVRIVRTHNVVYML